LGADAGPNPTDRGKSGSKHHVTVDGAGTPRNPTATAANWPDVTQFVPLVAGTKFAVPAPDGEDRPPARVLGDGA